MGRNSESIIGAVTIANIFKGIDYSYRRGIGGNSEIIIKENSIQDKSRLYNALAEFYGSPVLFSKNDFSDFLAKYYKGEAEKI